MTCKSLFAFFALPTILMSAAFLGCNQSAPKAKSDDPKAQAKAEETNAEVAAALAELSEEDRPIALAQKFCAVEHENLLGSMGKPYKLMIEGQAVFLCCEGCEDDALKDPQATLAKVDELKRTNSQK